jgi:hypothetical protein
VKKGDGEVHLLDRLIVFGAIIVVAVRVVTTTRASMKVRLTHLEVVELVWRRSPC